MDDLPNLLKRYFIFLENHCQLWENLLKKTAKPLSSIESLADQLHAISGTSTDVPIKRQFPNLEEHIIFKTFMSLEEELVPIINIVQEVSKATDKLNKIASSIDHRKDLNDFSLASISIGMLLEYVSDSRQYYQAQYCGLQIALKCLDLRDASSIINLRKSFAEDSDLKKHIQCCLLFGKQFITILEDTAALPPELQ